jgi:hypothetical protein
LSRKNAWRLLNLARGMFEPDENVDYIELAGFVLHQTSVGCIEPRDYNGTDSDYDIDVDFLDFSILNLASARY